MKLNEPRTLEDGTQVAPFSYDFFLQDPEGKAPSVTEDENGDVWIEGYASDFGIDRQEEAFEPGAFEKGLKSFMDTNPVMLYHHQYDKALGQYTEARLDAKGLWVKGRVDKPTPGSWAEDVVSKIKRGTIKAFSVGGIFKRRMTPNGPRIFEADLGEISVTPFPINPRTTFSVVGAKAFAAIEEPPAESSEDEDEDVKALAEATEKLDALFSRLEPKKP